MVWKCSIRSMARPTPCCASRIFRRGAAQIGVMCAAPMGVGFTVRFDQFGLEKT
jgi:regulation of enolase protein 1 (concanavalin A-like superfamily)